LYIATPRKASFLRRRKRGLLSRTRASKASWRLLKARDPAYREDSSQLNF
jgi:hypothetical protein